MLVLASTYYMYMYSTCTCTRIVAGTGMLVLATSNKVGYICFSSHMHYMPHSQA